MCVVAFALAFSAIPCSSYISVQASHPQARISARRLGNPELDAIRGGQGFLWKLGRNGIARLVQDGNTRDMTFILAPAGQQMDNWWASVGADYIAASLSRP